MTLLEYYDPESSPHDALGRAARRLESRGAMYLGGGVGCEKQGDAYMVTMNGKPSRKSGGPLSAMTHAFTMAGSSTAHDTPGGATMMKDPAAAARVRELDAEVADARDSLSRHRARQKQTRVGGIGAVLPVASDFTARAIAEAQRRVSVAQRERARLMAGPTSEAQVVGVRSSPSLTDSLIESAKTAALSVTHAPIGKGGTNWITKTKPGNTGQLPAYIQNIRNAIMRDGKDESSATAIAISRVKGWAAGTGNVGAEVRAAAAKALAEWEKLKAKAHAKVGEVDHDYDGHYLDQLAEGLLVAEFEPMLLERQFTGAQRRALAAKGYAMPDGSYPIVTMEDLREAQCMIREEPEDQRAAIATHIRRQLIDATSVAEGARLVDAKSPEMLCEMFGASGPAADARAQTGTKTGARATTKPVSNGGASYDETKHKRAPKGAAGGGRFVAAGASGGDVRAVQRGVGASADGQFGGVTKQKVEAFQRKHGLTVDGVVGHQTALALAGSYQAARDAKPGSLKKGDLHRVRVRQAAPHTRDKKTRSGGGTVV